MEAPRTEGGGQGRGTNEARLLAALEAERAGTAYWRRVAQQRTEALDALKRRPIVRGALALDRRTAPARHQGLAVLRRLRSAHERAMLVAAALPLRRALPGRRAALVDALGQLPAATHRESVALIVVAMDPLPLLPEHLGGASVHVVSSTGLPVVGARVTQRGGGEAWSAAAGRAIDETESELVCLMTSACVPMERGWLGRLAGALGDGVVGATPVAVHPQRSLVRATPHDLLVRAEGLEVQLTEHSAPVVRSRRAGRIAHPSTPREVVAAATTCVLFDRRAYRAVGGLAPIHDFEAALIDLCVRLGKHGGQVVCVPGSVVQDHRPVRSRAELVAPLGDMSTGWRRVVDLHGPALVRMARDRAGQPAVAGFGGKGPVLRIAVTVASPSEKVAHRWGDWHMAEGLAAGLRRAGHQARVQTAADANSHAGRSCGVHLVLRGLSAVRRSDGQRHVLWIISHPEAVEGSECDEADLVLVASERFAEALRHRTTTPVEVLLQATDPERFYPRRTDPAYEHAVTVVAKSRDVLRPIVANALAAGLRPAIYGSGWRTLIDPDLVVADHVANDLLPVVYSSAGVVLNDHWDTMRAWGFVSNRVFDVLACGAPLISDPLPELVDLFGDAVATADSPEELAGAVARALDDPVRARDRVDGGRREVLRAHTFDHRARTMLELLARHGLVHEGR
ncbi:MAG: glycosyltransferase [Acidimicrobiales bacterium]